LICAIELKPALPIGVQHRLDAGHCSVESPRDLAIGFFYLLGMCRLAVERFRQSGAIDSERVELLRQAVFAAIRFATSLDRGIERIERQRKALDRSVDRTRLRHDTLRLGISFKLSRLDRKPYVPHDCGVNCRATICPLISHPVHGPSALGHSH
jgi:hypothetical protein